MKTKGLLLTYPDAAIVSQWRHFPLGIHLPSAPRRLQEDKTFSIGKPVWTAIFVVYTLFIIFVYFAVRNNAVSSLIGWFAFAVSVFALALTVVSLHSIAKFARMRGDMIDSGLKQFDYATLCLGHELGLSLEAIFQGTKEELTELCEKKLTDFAERMLCAESLRDTAAKLMWKGSMATAHHCFMRSGFAEKSDWEKAFQRADQKIKKEEASSL